MSAINDVFSPLILFVVLTACTFFGKLLLAFLDVDAALLKIHITLQAALIFTAFLNGASAEGKVLIINNCVPNYLANVY